MSTLCFFWLTGTLHVLINHDCPNHHATYDDPPQIRHELPKSNVQIMEKFHYEGMDRKPKTTQEDRLIEAHLTMGESTGFLTQPRKTNPSLLMKLEPIPKFAMVFLVQGMLLLESMKWLGWLWNKGLGRHGCKGYGVLLSPNSVNTRWKTFFPNHST